MSLRPCPRPPQPNRPMRMAEFAWEPRTVCGLRISNPVPAALPRKSLRLTSSFVFALIVSPLPVQEHGFWIAGRGCQRSIRASHTARAFQSGEGAGSSSSELVPKPIVENLAGHAYACRNCADFSGGNSIRQARGAHSAATPARSVVARMRGTSESPRSPLLPDSRRFPNARRRLRCQELRRLQTTRLLRTRPFPARRSSRPDARPRAPRPSRRCPRPTFRSRAGP